MFSFLKRRIHSAVRKVAREIEKAPSPEEVNLEKEIVLEAVKKEQLEDEIEKKGFVKKITEKITTKRISEEQFDSIFKDLELALLENNTALEVVDKIKSDLKSELLNRFISRSKIEEEIEASLKKSLKNILSSYDYNLFDQIKRVKAEERPYVILIIGYNGSGKSLTCARLAYYLKHKNFKPLLAAGDTFRAAGAIQLVEYGKLADVPVIYNEKTKDSCSVIFDAIHHAKAKNYDVVVADTSGRIQNNQDLMDELKKISRINNPDLTLLVLDSLTGSDVVSQVEEFDKSIAVDGLILTKVDVDEKGGAFLSAIYTGKKPVLFIGKGQRLADFEEYNPEIILNHILS